MKSKYEGLLATLVWDGGNVSIPDELGAPKGDQMKGSPLEQLSELSGRTCYDSLGRGRNSEDYHKHILDVGHLSVYEHPHLTVEFQHPIQSCAMVFLNRPGIWIEPLEDSFRLTYNPRVVLDWEKFGNKADHLVFKGILECELAKRAGFIFPVKDGVDPRDPDRISRAILARVVEPQTDEEKWISLYMVGSRGFSHEQVRHGDFSAISQRSTRYVNEAESPWVTHPLIQEYLLDKKEKGKHTLVRDVINDTTSIARKAYIWLVEVLEEWLVERGVEKSQARKQARGAARGYLGNALTTELIFSASVGQWKRMLRMRAADPADGEIRALYIAALPELRKSRYGSEFSEFRMIPASDTIGESLVEEEPKE